MNEEILNKLKKLLALQEGAEKVGSIAEAENAAMRVNELLMKYNLSMSDVRAHASGDEREAMVKGDIKYEDLTERNESDWVLYLYHIIARHNLCKVIKRKGMTLKGELYHYLSLVGYKVNCEIVDYTCKQLVVRIREMARRAYKSYTGEVKRNTWIRGYLRGAVDGINAKLDEAIKEMQVVDTNIHALITTNQLVIKETVDKLFPQGLVHNQPTSLSGKDGRDKGYVDSKNMQIHKGLNGETTNPVLGNKHKRLS